MLYQTHNKPLHTPWNKGKLTGQKPPLKLNEIWAIRIRLQIAHKTRDLALFNLALDSKLRSCDLVKLKVSDVAHGTHMAKRSMVMQMKTKKPVQFEITKQTRNSLSEINYPAASYLATARLSCFTRKRGIAKCQPIRTAPTGDHYGVFGTAHLAL